MKNHLPANVLISKLLDLEENCRFLTEENIIKQLNDLRPYKLKLMVFVKRRGEPVYRVVKHNTPPKHKSFISYPPVKLCKEYGRCNSPYSPKFYGARLMGSAIKESNLTAGDKFCVSTWRLKSDLPLFCIGYSDINVKTKNLEAKAPQISREAWHYSEFISRQFLKIVESNCEYKYRLSATISEQLLSEKFDHTEIQGVIYPSMANELGSDNMVFTPEVVDENFKLECVDFCEFHSMAENNPIIEILDFAKPDTDGGLNWEGKGRPTPKTQGTAIKFL